MPVMILMCTLLLICVLKSILTSDSGAPGLQSKTKRMIYNNATGNVLKPEPWFFFRIVRTGYRQSSDTQCRLVAEIAWLGAPIIILRFGAWHLDCKNRLGDPLSGEIWEGAHTPREGTRGQAVERFLFFLE